MHEAFKVQQQTKEKRSLIIPNEPQQHVISSLSFASLLCLSHSNSHVQQNKAHVPAVRKLCGGTLTLLLAAQIFTFVWSAGETGRIRWEAEQRLTEQVWVEWMLKTSCCLVWMAELHFHFLNSILPRQRCCLGCCQRKKHVKKTEFYSMCPAFCPCLSAN